MIKDAELGAVAILLHRTTAEINYLVDGSSVRVEIVVDRKSSACLGGAYRYASGVRSFGQIRRFRFAQRLVSITGDVSEIIIF